MFTNDSVARGYVYLWQRTPVDMFTESFECVQVYVSHGLLSGLLYMPCSTREGVWFEKRLVDEQAETLLKMDESICCEHENRIMLTKFILSSLLTGPVK